MTASISSFIGSIGINTHINFGDSVNWSNITLVSNSLSYLGINHIRDAVPQATGGIQPLSTYETMMKNGVKFDFQVTGQNFSGSTPFAAPLSVLNQLATASPGGITAIEGFNEPANWPVTFNGATSPQSVQAAQTALYQAIRADATLNGIPVDDLSEGYYYNSTLFRNNAGRADYQNLHVYPQSGTTPNNAPPGAALAAELAKEYNVAGPKVITEFGYYTQTDNDGMSSSDPTWTGTTNALQGTLILDGLLDAYQQGFAETYLYDLLDAYKTTSANDYFGLFNYDGTPKAAATDLHNLTTLLKDTGPSATSFTPGTLQYQVTGGVSGDNSMMMEKSDGTYWLAVWNETAGSHQITVSLGSNASNITLFDPIKGTAAQQTVSNAGKLSFTLGGDPVLVEIQQAATVPPTPEPSPTPVPSTNDTITLRVSEDAWQGDAQFTVKVDGTQVGGTLTASALHATGDANVFLLTGKWGTTVHDVQLQFLNDTYGGTAATDRNLYVNSIAYDGVTYSSTTASMLSNGAHDFSVSGSVAAGMAPSDTLTLHMAQNAWNGNAQFQLTIDGKQISSPQDVVTLHSSGAWQDLTFAGNFGAGTHTVGVLFTNDAYGGTATTDRNLYVNGVDCNGQHYGSGVTALMSNGMAAFTITTTH